MYKAREMMDKVCKFKIGELVSIRGQNMLYKAKFEAGEILSKDEKPDLCIVRERFVAECYSGIQIFYDVERYNVINGQLTIYPTLFRTVETELEIYEYQKK